MSADNPDVLRLLAFNATTTGVVITDASLPDNPIVEMNHAFETLTGYGREEVLGRNCRFLQGPETDRAAVDRIRAAIAEGREAEETLLNYRKDGTTFWNELCITPVHDDAGEVTHFVGVQADVTARVTAEEALRQREARFRGLVEQLPAVVLVWPQDDPNRLVYASPRLQDLLGYTPAEAMVEPDFFFNRMHPDDAARVRAAETRSLEGAPICEEYRVRSRDGRWVWIRDESILVGEGNGAEWQGIMTDLTAHKASEEALRASEARLAAVWNAVRDAMALSDSNGIVLAANPAYLELYGFTEAEVVGRPFSVIFPEEQRPAAEAQYRAVFAGSAPPPSYESTVRRRDGTERVVESRAGFVEVDGRRVGLVSSIRDITEARMAANHATRLAAVVESAEDAILVENLDGTVMSWNAAAERMYGWTAAEMIGQSVTAIVPEDQHRQFVDALDRIARGERVERLEGTRITKNGRRLEVSLTLSPLRDPMGNVVGASVIARDVSQQRRAEEALRAGKAAAEQANRMKSEFLSTVSHELRTPLTAIIGYGELLLAGIGDPLTPSQEEDVRHMVGSGDRLLELVNDVLDLSRLEAGRLEIAHDFVDANWVAAQACADVMPVAQGKGLKLDVAGADSVPLVVGDARRIRQIVTGLLSNAIKFTDRGGITVSVRDAGDGSVDVAVSDTGIGIAPEHLPSVFDEFFQADASSTRAHGGTGLGLAIGRKLAELQGGTIVARSTLGEGSTFTLVLPAARISAAEAGE